jgi:hypothetical protein
LGAAERPGVRGGAERQSVFRFVGIGIRSRFLCVVAFSDGEPLPLRRKTL